MRGETRNSPQSRAPCHDSGKPFRFENRCAFCSQPRARHARRLVVNPIERLTQICPAAARYDGHVEIAPELNTHMICDHTAACASPQSPTSCPLLPGITTAGSSLFHHCFHDLWLTPWSPDQVYAIRLTNTLVPVGGRPVPRSAHSPSQSKSPWPAVCH